MRCAAVDDLEIYCKFNEDDTLTVSQDQGGLCIEIDILDPRSGVACVYLTTETAQQLAEALINWVNEQ